MASSKLRISNYFEVLKLVLVTPMVCVGSKQLILQCAECCGFKHLMGQQIK